MATSADTQSDTQVVTPQMQQSAAGQAETQDAVAGRRRWFRPGASSARRIGILILIVVAWQAYVSISGVQAIVVPSPLEVVETIFADMSSGRIIEVTSRTIRTLLVATALGLGIGFALAAFAVVSQFGKDLLGVLVAIFTPLPSIAILPLAMIWFGLSTTAIVVVVVNSVIWPVAINTDMGFRSISPTIRRVARNLGVRGLRLVKDVMFPAALPSLLTGLKTGWAFGWRTVVAAELVFGVAGGSAGLGWYINEARYFLNTSRVFAGLIVISSLGILIEGVFRAAEKATVERWGMTNVTER